MNSNYKKQGSKKVGSKKAKAKKFVPHIMYSPSGKPVKANTNKEHLALKAKGFGHTKPKAKRPKK